MNEHPLEQGSSGACSGAPLPFPLDVHTSVVGVCHASTTRKLRHSIYLLSGAWDDGPQSWSNDATGKCAEWFQSRERSEAGSSSPRVLLPEQRRLDVVFQVFRRRRRSDFVPAPAEPTACGRAVRPAAGDGRDCRLQWTEGLRQGAAGGHSSGDAGQELPSVGDQPSGCATSGPQETV